MHITKAAALCASIPGKRTMAILDMVAIESRNGTITMTSTNTEIGIQATSQYYADDFSCCIDAKSFAKALSMIDDPTLKITKKGLNIKKGKTQLTLPTIPYDNHPLIPTPADGVYIGQEIVNIINHVHYAAAVDDSRACLNGIKIEGGNGTITAVASNGIRLAKSFIHHETPEFNVIIPLNAAKMIVNLKPSQIRIGSVIHCYGDDIVMYCNVIDSKYPTFDKALKFNFSIIRVDKESLLQALKPTSILKSVLPININLEWRDGTMKIYCKGDDGSEVSDEIECASDIDGAYKANLKLFSDMIQAADDGMIEINYVDNTNPMLIHVDNKTHLIMPCV